MKKHVLRPILCLLAFLLLQAGCSGAVPGSSAGGSSARVEFDMNLAQTAPVPAPAAAPEYSKELYGYDSGADLPAGEATRDESGFLSADQRKVIFTYTYQIETKDMSATLSAIESFAASGGGFLSNANYGGRSDDGQYAYAYLTFRIPTASAGAFQDALEQAGNVRSKNNQSSDVTEAYFDTEARLTVLNAQETRLLALLEQSGRLSDLLEIENELARVRTEIERLTGTLRKYNDLIELTTFTVEVTNVRDYTPPPEETFLSRLSRAVVDSLRGALEAAQNLLLILVYALPYVILAGVIVLIVVLRRRRGKKHVQKQNDDGDHNPDA